MTADLIVSVGHNPLEGDGTDFVRTAELANILRGRWHLDTFGARTDELLRNSLFVLSANGLALVELDLSISSDLCDPKAAADCGRKLFKALDDDDMKPNKAPLVY